MSVNPFLQQHTEYFYIRLEYQDALQSAVFQQPIMNPYRALGQIFMLFGTALFIISYGCFSIAPYCLYDEDD